MSHLAAASFSLFFTPFTSLYGESKNLFSPMHRPRLLLFFPLAAACFQINTGSWQQKVKHRFPGLLKGFVLSALLIPDVSRD